jgi:hypothetical protein
MNEDLLNAYLEVLNNTVSELTKQKIILQAQLIVSEKQKAEFQSAYEKLAASTSKKKLVKVEGSEF